MLEPLLNTTGLVVLVQADLFRSRENYLQFVVFSRLPFVNSGAHTITASERGSMNPAEISGV